MGYSIGLKTSSEKQSKEILDYIDNISTLQSIKNYKKFIYPDLQWNLGNNLAYINNESEHYIGINYNQFDNLETSYFYSIIYAIAFKFNLTTQINKIDCVILNYDDSEIFYLAKENPFSKENDGDLFLSHVPINENGLKLPYEKKGCLSLLFPKVDKKDIKNIQLIIEKII
jgi:hypothetical protein